MYEASDAVSDAAADDDDDDFHDDDDNDFHDDEDDFHDDDDDGFGDMGSAVIRSPLRSLIGNMLGGVAHADERTNTPTLSCFFFSLSFSSLYLSHTRIHAYTQCVCV